MFFGFARRWKGNASARAGASLILAGIFLALGQGRVTVAHAQARPAGFQDADILAAGGTGSGYYVQYGERKMLGATAFVDFDRRRPLGIEAEAQWQEYRQFANVHVETYSVGPRYHHAFGRYRPYVKGMVGLGDFNFPYSLANGRYLIVTGGGGADVRLSHHVQIRAVDVEYQDWLQFTFGKMTTLAVSSGLRIRIF